ncbi:DUF1816 domain-containing protein [Synechocystis sp. PCC 7509]|uniref:DUF1816 domain-containing protein n=1 Tax=Synechocystis sp. PCC 7509 TaxID=927677 RepID=UPI0002AC0481|nr:DUF1816 domain-containing protein [Synechocystis sp. PCC 7509]
MKNIWHDLKEILTNFFQGLGWAWWVEVVTQNPRCTYYFGPFLSINEARTAINGYVEDLEQEGATEINLQVKRCKPQSLTIAEDLGEKRERYTKPAFNN